MTLSQFPTLRKRFTETLRSLLREKVLAPERRSDAKEKTLPVILQQSQIRVSSTATSRLLGEESKE